MEKYAGKLNKKKNAIFMTIWNYLIQQKLVKCHLMKKVKKYQKLETNVIWTINVFLIK